MSLVFGVVFSAAAILLYSWAFAQHRRPVPAQWTRHGWMSCMVAIVIVTFLPAAGGSLALAVSDPGATWASLNPLGMLAILLAILAVAVGAPRFIREGRGAVAAPLPVRPEGFKRAA